mmetsp:Transcript_15910/g.26498  ORF Transcript_15910/g.26498 Transcript_15910/m.26498 type:complete len:98 (-) Transcript_15910:341-634(-)
MSTLGSRGIGISATSSDALGTALVSMVNRLFEEECKQPTIPDEYRQQLNAIPDVLEKQICRYDSGLPHLPSIQVEKILPGGYDICMRTIITPTNNVI